MCLNERFIPLLFCFKAMAFELPKKNASIEAFFACRSL